MARVNQSQRPLAAQQRENVQVHGQLHDPEASGGEVLGGRHEAEFGGRGRHCGGRQLRGGCGRGGLAPSVRVLGVVSNKTVGLTELLLNKRNES